MKLAMLTAALVPMGRPIAWREALPLCSMTVFVTSMEIQYVSKAGVSWKVLGFGRYALCVSCHSYELLFALM